MRENYPNRREVLLRMVAVRGIGAMARIVIVLLVAAMLPAQTRQFDLYSYSAPDGYTVRASG
jgi:hypothetical protein